MKEQGSIQTQDSLGARQSRAHLSTGVQDTNCPLSPIRVKQAIQPVVGQFEIAPGLLKKLKERRNDRGTPGNKLHSWLSSDVGFPEVLVHLGTVVGLMKLHTDYAAFEKQSDWIAPIYPETPGLFDDPKDWEPRG